MAKRETILLLRGLVWVGLLLAIAAIVSGAIARKETSPIADVNVTVDPLPGNNFLITAEDVPAILERRFAHDPAMMAIGQVDVERVERVLEEDPFVQDAEAYVGAQNRLNIHVVQREPVLRVMDNNGLDYYLDADGQQMPPSAHYTARVLVATGNLPPYEELFREQEANTLNHVFALNELLREDDFLRALVEQIYVNNRGELTLAPSVGNQVILFGRYQQAEEKLHRLKVFYREGLPYKGWNAYRSFDLRYNGQVVCKKR
ncbi:MAG: cell division protein FtsQ/DivIB [Lewinella sp.]|nr:cell division protein FtsQ/DivIB [Lewinella sp.]